MVDRIRQKDQKEHSPVTSRTNCKFFNLPEQNKQTAPFK